MSADIVSEVPFGLPATLSRESFAPSEQSVALDPTEPITQESSWRRHPGVRWAGAIAVGTVLTASGAIGAIAAPGGEHIDIAGQNVSIRPEIGYNTSNLAGLAKLNEYKRIPIINKNIGIKISGDIGAIDLTNPEVVDGAKQIAADPDPEKQRVIAASTKYMIERGLEGGLTTALLYGGVLWRLGTSRRKKDGYSPEETALVSRHNRTDNILKASVAGAVSLGLMGYAAQTVTQNHYETVESNPQLDQIGVHGVELSRLGTEIAPVILAFLPPTNEFYDGLERNAEQAISKQPMLASKPAPGITRIGVVDDFQGTTGEARVTGHSFRQAHVEASNILGDWTYYGSSYEDSIFDSYLFSAGTDAPSISSGGLHDTPEILKIGSDRGVEVTDNKTHEINGIKILSLTDPRISTVSQAGHGSELRDPNISVEEFLKQSLHEISLTNPEIVTMHDHELALKLIAAADRAGCPLKLVVAGRSYDFEGPSYIKNPVSKAKPTTLLTVGSGGGHHTTDDDPGIIQGTATAAVLDVNRSTGSTYYYVLTSRPDGSYTTTPPINTLVPYNNYLKSGQTEPVGSVVTYTVPYSAAEKTTNEKADAKQNAAKGTTLATAR